MTLTSPQPLIVNQVFQHFNQPQAQQPQTQPQPPTQAQLNNMNAIPIHSINPILIQ